MAGDPLLPITAANRADAASATSAARFETIHVGRSQSSLT